MTDQTIKCPQCQREYEHRDWRTGCPFCQERERDMKNGMRWCRIDPLPSAMFWKAWSPLAVMGTLELSHSHRGYWCIAGRVPIAVANEMYADPTGRDMIRVAGHCGCPSPDEWAEWFLPDGRKVLPTKEWMDCNGYLNSPGPLAKVAREILDACEFSDSPGNLGASAFVTSYHIDGNLGLRVFVDTLERHGLYVPSPKTPSSR